MNIEIGCIDKYDAMEKFGNDEIDILFRTWNEQRNRMTGWRSFQKVCKTIASPIWPWEYPCSQVEWKYVRVS